MPAFTVGGTVQAGDGIYISRRADEELLKLCLERNYAYVLSPRQVGKTSLMTQVARRLEKEGVLSAKLDLTRLGTQVEPEAWYFGFLYETARQLGLKELLINWWEAHHSFGPSQRFALFFEEVILAEIQKPIVIFVDEIDSTLNLDFTDDFYATVRSFYDSRAELEIYRRLSFVFIGVATPGDLIRDAKRTPFNIGQRVEMTYFSFEEARPLGDGLGVDPTSTDKILRWILNWTGGHPYLTQSLCRAIAIENRKTWSKEAIRKLVIKTFAGSKSEQDNNLQFVRDMLTRRAPFMDAILTTYYAVRTGRTIKDEERSLTKAYLKLSGVVRPEANILKVSNEIYRIVFNRRWVREHLNSANLRYLPPSYLIILAYIVVAGFLLIGLVFFYTRTTELDNQLQTLKTSCNSTLINSTSVTSETKNAPPQLTVEVFIEKIFLPEWVWSYFFSANINPQSQIP